MIFADRAEAGERLGEALRERLGGANAVVLAIPRGGVIVGEAAARALGAPLDVAARSRLFPFLPAGASLKPGFTRKEWVDIPESEG